MKEGQDVQITLRQANLQHIHEMTGIPLFRLQQMLEDAKKRGRHSVDIPLGTYIFSRGEGEDIDER